MVTAGWTVTFVKTDTLWVSPSEGYDSLLRTVDVQAEVSTQLCLPAWTLLCRLVWTLFRCLDTTPQRTILLLCDMLYIPFQGIAYHHKALYLDFPKDLFYGGSGGHREW